MTEQQFIKTLTSLYYEFLSDQRDDTASFKEFIEWLYVKKLD